MELKNIVKHKKFLLQLLGVVAAAAVLGLLSAYSYNFYTQNRSEKEQLQTKIKTLQQQKISLDSLKGRYIYELWGIHKSLFDSFCQKQSLSSPFLLVCIKQITCGSCYNEQISPMHDMIQAKIPIVLASANPMEIDLVQRDLRNKVTIIPPPWIEKWMQTREEYFAVYCIHPSGLILSVEIPVIKFPENSKPFYRYMENVHKTYSLAEASNQR